MMSWPPDAPEPDADSTPESGTPETEAPVVEAEAAPQTEAPPAKPPRRRAPRARKDPATPVGDAPETEAPVVEAEAAPEPVRRRGRRTASPAAEAPPPPAFSQGEAFTPRGAEAPPAEASRPTRRRGRQRADEPEAAGGEAAAEATKPTRRRGRLRATEAQAPVVNEPPAETAPAEAPAPTRRRGRRRTSEAEIPAADSTGQAAGAPAEEEFPAPEAESEAAPQTRTSARRRGRRHASALVLPAPPELGAPVVQTPAGEAEAAAAEEGEVRKKRRRSRRRRGQDDAIIESVELTETGQPQPETGEDEDEVEDTFFPPPPPPPPVYDAPPLVPPALPPAADSPLPRTAAAVRHGQGLLPQIVIGDRTHAPYLFFVNAEAAERGEAVDSQIREAAAAGIHLYSGVMYLPLKNAYGDRSFGATDALVQQVLAADPDAYLLPRLQFVPTNYWVRTHPEQAARYGDGSVGDVSLASAEFWADCVDALESLIAHFSDPGTPGGDRVIGFHLDRGEWFHDALSGPDLSELNREAFQHWLQAKYQTTYALRAAWYDGRVTFDDAAIPVPTAREGQADTKKGTVPLYAGARDGRWVDYALFSSQIVARVITGLAAAVKTLSAGRLLVAVSYGYTMEFCARSDSGHLALGQLLDSPDVDIVAGPNSYAARGAGGTGAFGALVDSVSLHGKLWMVEDDTKTFLAETETPDAYNPRILSGADTQAAHQRHFGAALAHGAGVAWMDLWGQGWLDSPDIWSELGGLRDQAALRDRIAGGRQTPEVAVLVDEASLAYLKNDPNGLGLNLVAKTRDLLLRAGGSVGFYLQSDVTRPDFPDAKLYLFLNALRVTTAERLAIRGRLQQRGKTLAWLYAPALFDQNGAATQESNELVGMTLRLQPWNARGGSQITTVRHPITERLRGGRRLGQEETLNPSYSVSDPQATVLAEYTSNGAPSLAVREHAAGWKTVFLGDPHLSLELLRGLYAYAGVHVYDAQDDIVSVGNHALLIHATFTGQRTVSLPQTATVYDATERSIVATDTRSFRVFLKARTTRLFLWGERSAVQAATGLSLPPPSKTASPPEPPVLPPPPDIRLPASLPLSEPATQIAARYERAAWQSGDGLETTLEVSDLAAVLEMEDGEPLGADADDLAGDETAGEENPRPRSRWQRRRAAARARRDAERAAQSASGGAPEAGGPPAPPVDISALLPDLPPRRPGRGTEPPQDAPREG